MTTRREERLAGHYALRRMTGAGLQPEQDMPEALWGAAERVLRLAEGMQPGRRPNYRQMPPAGAERQRMVAAALYVGGWVRDGQVLQPQDGPQLEQQGWRVTLDLWGGYALGDARLRYSRGLEGATGPAVDLIVHRERGMPRRVLLGSVVKRVRELVAKLEVEG